MFSELTLSTNFIQRFIVRHILAVKSQFIISEILFDILYDGLTIGRIHWNSWCLNFRTKRLLQFSVLLIQIPRYSWHEQHLLYSQICRDILVHTCIIPWRVQDLLKEGAKGRGSGALWCPCGSRAKPWLTPGGKAPGRSQVEGGRGVKTLLWAILDMRSVDRSINKEQYMYNKTMSTNQITHKSTFNCMKYDIIFVFISVLINKLINNLWRKIVL